ncbi:hypothetical protein C0J52_01170 [Blattella germanica]|nr:hypothetical protein C0J52_01170 [Blattella germanica]
MKITMQLNVSEVAEEIKLSRGDAKSWGFRVTGGLDFGTPLTVIKVEGTGTESEADKEVETHNENPENEEPPPPPKPKVPSLFETIFGPLDEPPTERCKSAFEELVEELTKQKGEGEETEPEKKKLSTFLIAPDRPKIKPKEKPKKPKEPPKQEGIEQSTESPKQEGKASDDNKNKESNENESQLVNEENVLNKEEEQPKEEQNIEQGSADIELSSENQRKDEPNDDQNKEAECTQENIPEAEKQPDDKLTAIQNQLAALLQLPSTMQQQLAWQHERPKKNKPFFPLTPQPRPIVLPARLRLKMNPESTYSDEFIAETLSGNAEIIMGTTIG